MKKSLLFMLFSVLVLSSCSKSPSANFYLLPAPELLAQHTNAVFLAVQKPLLPEYLQRPQLVLRTENSAQVKIEEYHRWAEDLATAFQRVLCNALDNELQDKNIDATPARIGLISPYKLNIYVNAFEGDLNKNATIDLVWSIEAGSRVVMKGIYKENLDTKGSYEELILTQSKLIENLATNIANTMKEKL